ncbi:MAG TPA: NADH:flavin oxidoreductase/NADH oxidase [Blastocatellia bacterium]|nr:NADH:flavin oxidoreductase/NADH oxidase [Blastocatellia bacterium]
MSKLFSPFQLRGVEFKNRIFVAPMCQYSCQDGMMNDWHLVHLGSRAVGGAALVMTEATAVTPEGRISPYDAGLWSDAHIEPLAPITRFIKAQNAVPAIQLAHAGRKASTDVPWRKIKPLSPAEGGWQPLAPSAVPFAEASPVPQEMTPDDLAITVQAFAKAARRSLAAGFAVIEIHMAHGYLLHEFLSPFSNHRTDEFGGDFAGRTRFPLQVAAAVRAVCPDTMPVFVRISSTDWAEGGWDLSQSIAFARELQALGIDLIDCSGGGAIPKVHIPVAPGYQVPFAAAIRKEAGIATGAVGLITEARQAEQILANDEADVVLLARELLRDPYWPLHAARTLGVDIPWPVQYERAKP